MKKLLLALLLIMLVAVVGCSKNESQSEVYKYEITEIKENEAHGIPLNKKSSDNGGIFFTENEVYLFDLKEGDKIAVEWGEYEDQFKSIKKLE